MTQDGARSVALPALLCAGIVLSACTSMGTGMGSVATGFVGVSASGPQVDITRALQLFGAQLRIWF